MKITAEWQSYSRDGIPTHLLEVDHELVDDKGRVIGGRAILVDRRGVNPPAGQAFELEIKTLRAGLPFGASRGSSFMESEAKAKAEAIKRLIRQGKGFAKLYGDKA